jgi:cation transport protein ChaC
LVSALPSNPPPTAVREWSAKERAADLARFLAAAPAPAAALWVFAAGSLIWNPRFEPAETRFATLHGYRRAFSMWTVRRGSPGRPGLALALEPGGSCGGLAFRLPEDDRDEVLAALWRREMAVGSYTPTWVRADTPHGAISALCFAANPQHRNYAGILPLDRAAAIIAAGKGPRGRCSEYLFLLVEALRRHGLEDADVEQLAHLVGTRLADEVDR